VGLRVLLVPVLVLGVLRAVGRRRVTADGRGWDEPGGGTAGVREPRNPLPTTLVDAGAAVPGD
jgi:hypothetical protein